MTLNLPKPVAAYFTADEADGEAVSRCFTDDAVVKDEGHTYNGRAAIKKWKEEASAKYRVHERATGVRAEGRQIRRHVPAYRKLSWQPGRSSVLLRTRRRQDRVVGNCSVTKASRRGTLNASIDSGSANAIK